MRRRPSPLSGSAQAPGPLGCFAPLISYEQTGDLRVHHGAQPWPEGRGEVAVLQEDPLLGLGEGIGDEVFGLRRPALAQRDHGHVLGGSFQLLGKLEEHVGDVHPCVTVQRGACSGKLPPETQSRTGEWWWEKVGMGWEPRLPSTWG